MTSPLSHGKSVGTSLARWLLVRHLGAVGSAAAFALAGVLALAAVVTGLATALALAGVLAFTSVLFFDLFVGSRLIWVLGGYSGLEPRQQIGRLDAGAGAREQARDSRASEEKLIRLCHILKNPHRF
jgi:hypothetical protein